MPALEISNATASEAEIDRRAIEENIRRPDHLFPIITHDDGNCFPRSIARAIGKDPLSHPEIRVRVIEEGVRNEEKYLENKNLVNGCNNPAPANLPCTYAMYSSAYTPSDKLDSNKIKSLYQKELLSLVRDGSYCGVWQFHQVASVLGCKVKAYYPQAMAEFLVEILAENFCH